MGFSSSENNNEKQKAAPLGPCALLSSPRPGPSSGSQSGPAIRDWEQAPGLVSPAVPFIRRGIYDSTT